MQPEVLLALLAALAIVVLVTLIVRVRMHAFPALMIVSLALGLGAGLEPAAVVTAFQQGVGNTLGFIAVVIGLGTFVGALLAESGGAAGRRARGRGCRRRALAAVGGRGGGLCHRPAGLLQRRARPALPRRRRAGRHLRPAAADARVAAGGGPVGAAMAWWRRIPARWSRSSGSAPTRACRSSTAIVAGVPAFALAGPLFLRALPPALLIARRRAQRAAVGRAHGDRTRRRSRSRLRRCSCRSRSCSARRSSRR